MENLFNVCLLLICFTGFITQSEAQDSTIRPIRHSLHFGGRQSLDGSLPNGGCTSVNDDGDICNLQDGGTSVLVDNTILPLNGLNGDWARYLYTVDRTTSFISIGFDFGTSVQVERVELVLFNCQQRFIRAGSITIYTDVATNLFPQLDPASVGTLVGERLLSLRVGVNSCDNLYKVCVPLLGANNRIHYIVFPHTAGSNRVYLAETTFYTDTRTCGNDTLVTEPVTPPPVDITTEGTTIAMQDTTTTPGSITTQFPTTVPGSTTTQGSLTTQSKKDITSVQTMTTIVTEPVTTTNEKATKQTAPKSTEQQTETTLIKHRAITTTENTVDMSTAQALPCVCKNTPIASLIAAVFTTTLLATIIIVALHIPLYVHHRHFLTSTKMSKETAAPADHEEATYEQIDETKHGAFLELRQSEAYGTARVTG